MAHFAASMLSRTITIRIDKARRELGYHYQPVVSVTGRLAQLSSGDK